MSLIIKSYSFVIQILTIIHEVSYSELLILYDSFFVVILTFATIYLSFLLKISLI
jgi:hypothetical protein